MAMNNLSIDGEFRYIIQWFNEWSELQRDDFVPVLVEYLLRESSSEVYMNGLLNAASSVGLSEKPMSLFQCRIKLFRDWNKKWPLEFKHKLKEKIIEIDGKVGEKVINELKTHASDEGTSSVCNGTAPEPEAVEAAESVTNEAVCAGEATDLDSHLAAVLHNETPVDDNDNGLPVTEATAPPAEPEPAEQVEAHQVQLQVQEENVATVTAA